MGLLNNLATFFDVIERKCEIPSLRSEQAWQSLKKGCEEFIRMLNGFVRVIASEVWQSHKREWIKGVIASEAWQSHKKEWIKGVIASEVWQSHEKEW
jgi:leucyl-tRNA synthetase